MKKPMDRSGTVKISNLQLFMMIIATTTPFGHFVYIHLSYLVAGRDAYVSLVVGSLVGAAIVYMQLSLVAKPAKYTLIEQTQRVFGPVFGRVLSSFYVLFFLLSSALTVRILTDFIGIILPNTPPPLISMSVLFLCAWLVFAGLEPLVRTVQGTLPFMMLLGIAASVLTTPDKHPENLLPILEKGVVPVWRGALIYITMFSEWISFTMMVSNTNQTKRVPKQGLMTIAIMLLMFIGPVTGPIMIFGEHLSSDTSYPTYLEISNIDVADFLQNLDTIGVLLWTVGAFLRISTTMYCASCGIADLIDKKNQTLFAFPVFLVVEAINLTMRQAFSQWETFRFIMTDYLVIVLFISVVLPLLTFVIAYFRGKRKEAAEVNS